MSTIILRLCPFCGHAPQSKATQVAENYEGTGHAWAVWCANRRCPAWQRQISRCARRQLTYP